jgi:hypothetical protein
MQNPNVELHQFPRITRMLPWIKPEQVATEIVRAITKRTHGQIIIPRLNIPLVLFGQVFPSLARLVMRLIG